MESNVDFYQQPMGINTEQTMSFNTGAKDTFILKGK